MRPSDIKLAYQLASRISHFEKVNGLLPGLEDQASRDVFIEQIIESVRRIDYVRRLGARPISELRKDPSSNLYDPLKAALLFMGDERIDEACWQVFISVHFGKSIRSGWRYPRDVYGRLDQPGRWGWEEVSGDVTSFREWLADNVARLKGADGIVRRFSNHRKYTSIDAWSDNGTGAAVASYVGWVSDAGGHVNLFASAIQESQGDPREAFRLLYQRMSVVRSFGRIGKFDYLTMIGKLGLADIEADSAYMAEATGPLIGAKLMFGKMSATKQYDAAAASLGSALGVNMQVMEDSLCNWQKSPEKFIAFRG